MKYKIFYLAGIIASLAVTSSDVFSQNYVRVPSKRSNGYSDSVAPSLRPEDAFMDSLKRDREPLEYQSIRKDDAVYMEKVWRVIDTREKINVAFRNPAQEGENLELFLAILYKAVTDTLGGGTPITAFADERFSQPLSTDKFLKVFSNGLDTITVYKLDGTIDHYDIKDRQINTDSIFQYQIKEEWIFDKERSRMTVRILGIAPMLRSYFKNGMPQTADPVPLFWIYYPDLRSTLAKRDVYSGKNFGARMSWEELFEGRMFSSFIIKSTLDNPFNQTLAEQYPKSTLFRLLEGEHVKDKIFDYEQGLWQY